jgi:hypothetical protein
VTVPTRLGTDAPPSSPLTGGHQLPTLFSAGTPTPAAAPRPARRKGLVFGLLGAVGVIAALAITQLSANLGYDGAAAQYDDAAQQATTAKADVRADTADLRGTTDAGGTVLSVENRPLVVTDEVETALTAAVSDGTAVASDAEGVLATGIAAVGTKPVWFWELFGAASALEQRGAEVVLLTDDLAVVSTDISDARAAITESGLTLLSAAAEAAPGFETAHLSARNDAVIALRNAAASVTAARTMDGSAATAYLSLQEAAARVIATESEELSEKAGPLMDVRLEIEAFARSLAPGVLLDFDWAPTVSGAGDNGSMGGYTTWWWDDPGRATIQLSNSVAEQWPAERSKALVAHEVGHAISVKCQGMYDASTQDSIEKWATAWAISMGFADDANGVWAYGYPPQNYIDAAAGCR